MPIPNNKKIIILTAVGLVALFFVAFSLSYFIYGRFVSGKKDVVIDNSPAKTPTPYFGETAKNTSTKNILLIGYGGAGHSGGTLADSIILLSLNSDQKTATQISIPRDIWLNLPTDWENLKPGKINEAHAIGLADSQYPNKKPEFRGNLGGGNMVKYAVSQVTGLSVDYFASVSFDQFEKLIDTLDGIKVNVKVGFVDDFYPIKGLENDTCGKSEDEVNNLKAKFHDFELEKNFTCRYEKLVFEKGEVTMNGQTALKFVRSRHSSQHGGDFARSERQMAVLEGVKDKLMSKKAFENLDEVYPPLAKLVATDLNLATAKVLAEFIGNPDAYKIRSINLSTENTLQDSRGPQGQFILLPKSGFGNWEETHKYLEEQIQN